MTDTDSLLLEIKTGDWYDDIRDEVKTLYDTSAYPENHPACLPRVNKKVIGLWKDEYKGRTVSEYAGTCSKSYALTLSDYPGMCEKSFCHGGCWAKTCIGKTDTCNVYKKKRHFLPTKDSYSSVRCVILKDKARCLKILRETSFEFFFLG